MSSAISDTNAQTKSFRAKNPVRWLTITAIFMGLNIIVSSFGIPVPGGHLYLCDTIICTAALLLDPVAAFIVGGVGSFLGDMLFYPAPMFVSLVTHGLQAAAVSLIAHSALAGRSPRSRFTAGLVATLVGGVIMVVGYTLGKIFVYSTLADAIVKLPYEIAQALLGVIGSLLLCFKGGLNRIFAKMEYN
ncbi:ECF transporter S component [Butyrivibrio sp. MC2021]|uniref:ECF transporter S component n=1 Tax=Butyrivibrio sp. MC2021 TaxID=1408306 RepID=UPI000478AC8D|nr:ECF transporter S component [Butyrivibrio sp. MC2021]